MPDSNTFLRALIAGAQSICIEKLDLAKTALGATNPAVVTTGKAMQLLFDALSAPDLWLFPMEVDSAPINRRMIALGGLGSMQAAEILTQIRQLVELLEQTVLRPRMQAVREAGDAPPTSDMNLQVMNALARTRQQIGIRLFRFAQAGQDLQQDPAFLAMQARQETLVNTYWEKLKTNAIIGRETDVIQIRQRGEFISSSFNVATFTLHYSLLSTFIQSHLPPA